jgi:hypothetical protein
VNVEARQRLLEMARLTQVLGVRHPRGLWPPCRSRLRIGSRGSSEALRFHPLGGDDVIRSAGLTPDERESTLT